MGQHRVTKAQLETLPKLIANYIRNLKGEITRLGEVQVKLTRDLQNSEREKARLKRENAELKSKGKTL